MLNSIKKIYRQYKFTDYLLEVEKKWNPCVVKKLGEPIDSYIEDVNKNGIVVLPNFFTGDELKSLQDECKRLAQNKANTKHKMEDKTFRIYGADKESEIIKKLYSENELFNKVAEVYYGKSVNRTDTVYQESYPSSKDRFERGFGLSGFHFDGIPRRFKIFVYLEDVELENGPFTYIIGSNDLSSFGKLAKMKKQYVEGGQTASGSYDHTYYSKEEEEKYKLWEKATPMVAKAGSVIFGETRGLHAAGEVKSGSRKVLVNYYK